MKQQGSTSTCSSDLEAKRRKHGKVARGSTPPSLASSLERNSIAHRSSSAHTSTASTCDCNRYNLSSHLTNLLGYKLPFDCITESVCEKARFVYNQKHKNESHELNSSHPRGSWTRVHEWELFCSVSPTTSSIRFITNDGTRPCRFRSYQWRFANYSKFVSPAVDSSAEIETQSRRTFN